jgi:hypothetical protein
MTSASVAQFHDISPEQHQHLQREVSRLRSENEFVNRASIEGVPIKEIPVDDPKLANLKAVQRYELARYQIDYPLSEATPRTVPAPAMGSPVRRLRDLDYAGFLASRTPLWLAKDCQINDAHAFMVNITEKAQAAIEYHLNNNEIAVDPMPVTLHCIGSYYSGFAQADSNLDILAVVSPDLPENCGAELPLFLVQSLLEAGIGARLSEDPKDRAALVVNVCQNVDEELLPMLKNEYGTDSKDSRPTASALRFSTRNGIQCNISFARDSLMLSSSDLLRCYRRCDKRVTEMATVIRKWARSRGIDNPERGTLSPYGYMMMLLHYLLHVADPPVVPNLQHTKLAKRMSKSVGGRTVCYFADEDEICRMAKAGRLTSNKQSVGSLIHGFFAYYSSQSRNVRTDSGTIRAFHWKDEMATLGPQRHVKKFNKGFGRPPEDRGRWNYIVVEDPFSGQNIATNVSPVMAKVIKEEFSRAHRIISHTRLVAGSGWECPRIGGAPSEELLGPRAAHEDETRQLMDMEEDRMKRRRPTPKKADKILAIADRPATRLPLTTGEKTVTSSISGGPLSTNADDAVEVATAATSPWLPNQPANAVATVTAKGRIFWGTQRRCRRRMQAAAQAVQSATT